MNSKLLQIILLGLIVASIPLTVFVAQKRQDIRQKAQEAGVFSNLFTQLASDSANFQFTYLGLANLFSVDISTTLDLSSNVFTNFASGSASPLVESNPIKWNEYTCGKIVYWKIKSALGEESQIQNAIVSCVTPTPASSVSATPTATLSASISPSPSPIPTIVPTATPTVLESDIDRDGCVGILDFNTWFQALRTDSIRPGTFPDVNKDGSVDLLDFNLWFKAMISLPANKLC